jgi:aryl-alcohol dehydrogenase-like predicted oxidoreductase
MGGMWGPCDDREAVRALQRALELGVTFLDTALVYGDGRAEALIAKALRGRPEPVVVATKVPPKNGAWPARHACDAREAFPGSWIIRCTERSLRRLKRRTVDLQQLHVWSPRWLAQQDEWLPAVERLKRQGKIRAFGASLNDCEPDTGLDLVASGLVDSVQVVYNLFEQAPADRLLPACRRHHVAVIARVPFDEGSLTGGLTEQTAFPPGDWRRDYFHGERLTESVRRASALGFLIRGEIRTLAQAALKFCLSHPAVSTVIPGMRRVAHVEENCAASDGRLLTSQELERLRAHAWPRNFYQRDVVRRGR